MKIIIITIGKKTEENLSQVILDFQNRIEKFIGHDSLEWKIISSIDRENKEEQKKLEGQKILENIKKTDFVILLDEKGSSIKTMDLADILENKMNDGVVRLTFIIGGAFGVSQEVFQRANYTLSISKFTLPHQLVRLIIIEQIYRAFSILNNSKYHHE